MPSVTLVDIRPIYTSKSQRPKTVNIKLKKKTGFRPEKQNSVTENSMGKKFKTIHIFSGISLICAYPGQYC